MRGAQAQNCAGHTGWPGNARFLSLLNEVVGLRFSHDGDEVSPTNVEVTSAAFSLRVTLRKHVVHGQRRRKGVGEGLEMCAKGSNVR